jgi:5,10-methylenetetrahydrofolate reductase
VTQPVFDIRLLENFLRRIEHCRIPVVAGIWPLVSVRNAEFMKNELRVSVPDSILERMAAPNAGSGQSRGCGDCAGDADRGAAHGARGADQRAAGALQLGGGCSGGSGDEERRAGLEFPL